MKTLTTLFLGMLLLAGTAFAQESAEKYGVKFPVSELGGCEGISSCRSFCEDPVNKSSCVSFAKQKGFYKEQGNRQEELLKNAQADLGCTTPDACREFCHQEGNFDKCSSFAKKHNTGGGQIDDSGRSEVLQKAREALGCESADVCRSLCQEEGNRQKCSDFAKQTGLRGGEKRVGPGGCSSEETCKSFCSDPSNFNACSSFGGGQRGEGARGGQFRGPGGCNSEESCRSHCEQNPQSCKIIPSRFDGAGPIDNPEQAQEQFKKYCEEDPQKCQGGSNFSPFSKEGRGKFEDFCKDNPERCRGEGDKFRGFEPRGNPEQFCKENPDKCQGGRPGGFEEGQGLEDQGCKDDPEKCRRPGQQGGSKDFRDSRFQGPPGEFRPQQDRRPSEGFRPPEGMNKPPDSQRPPDGAYQQSGGRDYSGSGSQPGGGGPPPGGDSGSSGGGGSPPGGDSQPSGDSGGGGGVPPPGGVQGAKTSIFNQVFKSFLGK